MATITSPTNPACAIAFVCQQAPERATTSATIRAQVSADWIDTITGEVSRARVALADRVRVRKFLAGFKGAGLEVGLEATPGWRFLAEELDRSQPNEAARGVAGVVRLAKLASSGSELTSWRLETAGRHRAHGPRPGALASAQV